MDHAGIRINNGYFSAALISGSGLTGANNLLSFATSFRQHLYKLYVLKYVDLLFII